MILSQNRRVFPVRHESKFLVFCRAPSAVFKEEKFKEESANEGFSETAEDFARYGNLVR